MFDAIHQGASMSSTDLSCRGVCCLARHICRNRQTNIPHLSISGVPIWINSGLFLSVLKNILPFFPERDFPSNVLETLDREYELILAFRYAKTLLNRNNENKCTLLNFLICFSIYLFFRFCFPFFPCFS